MEGRIVKSACPLSSSPVNVGFDLITFVSVIPNPLLVRVIRISL